MLVSKKAPDFKATAVMPNNTFKDISLSDYAGKKVVLFFYPFDFTFVCPTEILAFDHRLEEFKKRGVEVLGCSIDSHHVHLAWKSTDINNGGIGNIQYPLISDVDKTIARNFDVLTEATPATVILDDEEFATTVDGEKALRASFLIDEDGVIAHAVINNLDLGRNVDEMLRMVDALSFFQKNGQVCPAGWKEGDDGMTDTKDGVADYLSKHSDKL